MIYNDFKGIKLSALGLGMMRLPVVDGQDSVVDEKSAAEMVDYAYKNGINYFDTAWVYHGGNSEKVVGRLLSKYPRESYFLATKFPGMCHECFDNIAEVFETQLQNCQTDYFDFYLFHNVCEALIDDYMSEDYKLLEYLLEQKKNGRIRHLGFSTHGSREVISRFIDAYGEHLEFCQLQLNYMDWHFQNCEEKIKLAAKAGIPVWVMEPVRGGKLATASDEMLAKMKAMRPEESVPGWAFRFLQSIPEVKVVLSGMSNMQQLKENIKTYSENRPLTASETDCLITQIDKEADKGELPCTSCRYCTAGCPKALDIPELIGMYNKCKAPDADFDIKAAISAIPEEKRPAACIGCKKCEQSCPQGIGISKVLKDLAERI